MKKLLLFVTCALFVLTSVAQETVTLTFTAKQQNNAYQRLDSVVVTNLTKDWTEVIYYPDTLLLMNTVGITDWENSKGSVKLYQNIPNPFHGITDFNLTLANKEKVELVIFDINGKKVAEYHNTLPSGEHMFRATMNTPQTYLLSAVTKNGNTSIKMINLSNTGAQAHIEYVSSKPLDMDMTKKQSQNPFSKGDNMKYVGYATQNDGSHDATLTQTQQGSETITFTFPTEVVEPEITVTTEKATDITFSSAKINGKYAADKTAKAVGFIWKSKTVEKWDTLVCAQVNATFSYYLNDLAANTEYLYKAFIKINDTIYVGEAFNFTTKSPEMPKVVTDSANNIGYTSVTLNGHYTETDEDIVKTGIILLKDKIQIDICENTGVQLANLIKCSFTGLQGETTYQYAAYATTNSGTFYGDTLDFTTLKFTLPVVTTDSSKLISAGAAVLYGSFVEGSTPISEIGFEYKMKGDATEWTKIVSDPIVSPFTGGISNLDEATEYLYKAFVKCDSNYYYGEEKSFKTITIVNCGTLKDIDGNEYKTIVIDGRCWMRENIKVTHFADGTEIIKDTRENIAVTEDFYYREVNGNYYYSAYTAARGTFCSETAEISKIQGICPEGWHFPSHYEWARLESAMGMPWSDAKQYKSFGGGIKRGNIVRTLIASPYDWDETEVLNAPGNRGSENTVAVGTSNMDIKPAGGCGPGNLTASNAGQSANFWTASGLWRIMNFNEATIDAGCWSNNMRDQYSIRCVKDLDPVLPTVSIENDIIPQYKQAIATGLIVSDGYATITEKGFCYSKSHNEPDINDSKTACETQENTFTANITGLEPNTHYYIRAYAVNKAGVGYSDTLSFWTTETPEMPIVITKAPEDIMETTALLLGELVNNGGDSISEIGFCLSTENTEPTIDDQKVLAESTAIGPFSVEMNNLKPGTTYYVCAFATNQAGTAYGDVLTMTTQGSDFVCGNNVTDANGNVYGTIQIGTQCWMTGNMKATRYDTESEAEGDIPEFEVKDLAEMFNPSYKVNGEKYYYNYAAALGFATGDEAVSYTAEEGLRQGICPNGWHVGTLKEWCILEGFVTNTTVPIVISGDKVANGFYNALSGSGAYAKFNISRDGQYKADGTLDAPTQSTVMMYATPLPEDYSATLSDLSNNDFNKPQYYHAKYWGHSQISWGYYNCAQNSAVPKCYNMAVRCIKTDASSLYPYVITLEPTEVTETTAFLHGNLIDDAGADIFELGFCLSTENSEPTIDDEVVLVEQKETGPYSAIAEDLAMETTYYVRAFATNSEGTSYGEVFTITTKGDGFNCGDDVVDIDGNTYGTIKIGSQCWMTGNMRAIHYDTESEGEGEIPAFEVKDLAEMFEPSYKENNGKYYYNYAAAMGFPNGDFAINMTDIGENQFQGICPNGWHVGTLEDWCTLEGFVTNTTVPAVISGNKVATGFFNALSGSGAYAKFNITRDGQYKSDGTLDAPTQSTVMMYATPLPEEYSEALTELPNEDFNKPQYYHAKYWGHSNVSWGYNNCAQNSAVPKCYNMVVRCILNY